MGLTVIEGIAKNNGFIQTEGLSRDGGFVMVGPFADVGESLIWEDGAEDAFLWDETSNGKILWKE